MNTTGKIIHPVKGFRNCERVTVKVGDEWYDLVVTQHCTDKLQRSTPDWDDMKCISTMIATSIVITDRPNNLNALLRNNCRPAIYLCTQKFPYSSKMIFVLEEDCVTREYRVLKTAYEAVSCAWISSWMGAHPPKIRQKFFEYFDHPSKLKVF